MESVFAERLSKIRKEKNISQKSAALDLGVSQALLSHYEKGIRECSPSFIVRAAAYYDVSADYLLGLSDKSQNMSEVFSENELPTDNEAVSQTVYRALVWLGKMSAEISPECSAIVLSEYRLMLYRILNGLYDNGCIYSLPAELSKEDSALFSVITEQILKRKIANLAPVNIITECPKCIDTVVKHCEAVMKSTVNTLHG